MRQHCSAVQQALLHHEAAAARVLVMYSDAQAVRCFPLMPPGCGRYRITLKQTCHIVLLLAHNA
jgi:hypothetical protein